MPFELTRLVLGKNGAFTMPLSTPEYLQLVRAHECILSAASIEEKVDLVIENFIELEVSLLEAAATYLARRIKKQREMRREANIVVNRRFLNVLSSCRGYLDHTPHHLSEMARSGFEECSELPELFKRCAGHQYDTFLGYRVMEAMRNHLQHRGFPLDVSYRSRWYNTEDGLRLMFSLAASIRKTALEEDKKFKRVILNEIKTIEKLDARRLCAEYVGGIGRIHDEIMKRLDETINHSSIIIMNKIFQFKKESGMEDTLGLAVVGSGDDSNTRPRYIGGRILEYLSLLREKRSSFAKFEDRFLSSEQFDVIEPC